jgi:hypothetical protein
MILIIILISQPMNILKHVIDQKIHAKDYSFKCEMDFQR